MMLYLSKYIKYKSFIKKGKKHSTAPQFSAGRVLDSHFSYSGFVKFGLYILNRWQKYSNAKQNA